jgi:hypothetical protein
MQAADDLDPCEIYFSDFRPLDGRRLPHRLVIRHGDEEFADLRISTYEFQDTAARSTAGSETKDKN